MNNGVTNNTNTNQTNSNVAAQPMMQNTNVSQAVPQIVSQEPVMTQQPQSAAQTPQIMQTVPVQPNVSQPASAMPQVPQAPSVVSPTVNNLVDDNKTEEPKKKSGLKNINWIPILLIIIVGLIAYTVFSFNSHKKKIENLMYNCTPITASKDAVKLDLNSTLVKDLYSKVYTTIREDLAQPEFSDDMRLYLAYRQILETDKYDSNCNLFDNLSMEPYTCEVSTKFRPKAFKEETMTQAIKKMYGEKSTISFANVRLGSSCIGGYQYIAARGEFVQGMCEQQTATSYRATKTLKEATSTRNTIILTEEVKYHENEGMTFPDFLKSGMYYYTFRLDMNYNYVLVSKTYESKY